MPVLQPEKTKPQKKPQARGFSPEAMAQAQVLNQQPDSIPAMMKPGEYVLPPDTVAAMGGPQALDATVAQTHTPTNAGAIVPKGFEPRLFFSSGGLAEEEEQKPISPANIYPQGSPSAGANVYGGAIDAAKSAVSAAANPQGGQPLVKGAAQMFGQREELQQQGRERWDASVAARQPAPAQPAQPVGLPAAAAAPTPRAQFVANQNQKLAAANTQLAERTAQLNERYKPAPNSPTNTFPANRMPVENGQPQQAPTAPAVTSGFASAQDGMANDFGRQPSAPTPMASAAPSTAPAQTPRAQFVADQNAKLEAANTRLAERTQEMNARYQPAPNSPSNTFPANRLPVESGAASVPPAGRGLPDPVTDPSSFTGDVLRTAGQDAKAAWQRGGAEGVGAAAGALVRGSMATPGAITVDAVDSVVNGPIGQGIGGFTRGLFGGAGQPPPPATPTTTARQSTAGGASAAPERTLEQLGKQLGGLDRQHAQNVQLQAAGRTPEQARAEAAEQPIGQQVPGLSGVYKHGEGQYSDNAQGMGFSSGRTGQPSAQNMQAANALASQQQAQSTARVQAAQQQAVPQARGFTGFEMPRQENAYEREARQRERNRIMGMLQTPLTGDPRRDLTASQRQQLVAQLGQESQERQSTERNMFGLAGQQINAETQRYSTDANTAVGAARNAIDQQRLGLDTQQQQEQSTARGFEIRGAQRREGILQQFDAAKTDQERAQLQQRYPDVFGKGDSPWKVSVTPATKNIDGSTSMGSVIRYNDQTGQVEEVKLNGAAQPPAAPQEASKRVVGQTYTTPNGQVMTWTEKGWVAA